MRSQYDIIHFKKRIVRINWLTFENIQRCKCNPTFSEGSDKGRLVYCGSPPGVDENGRGFHLLKLLNRDHVVSFFC